MAAVSCFCVAVNEAPERIVPEAYFAHVLGGFSPWLHGSVSLDLWQGECHRMPPGHDSRNK